MKILILILVSLIGCAHNYADSFVSAVNPDADVVARGSQTVLFWQGTQLIACRADAKHHTTCGLVADWTPKQSPSASPSKSTVEQPQAEMRTSVERLHAQEADAARHIHPPAPDPTADPSISADPKIKTDIKK